MDKTKVLFLCASLKVGGAEKSLVNLLNLIDYTKYEVDLLLLQKQGDFLGQLPKEVTLLEMKPNAKALYDKTQVSLRRICMQIIKYASTAWETICWKEYDALRAHRWIDVYRHICEPIEKHYNVAVGYQSGESTYYMLDKVKADRYVTFFHTDISNIVLDHRIERRYLAKTDKIITISNQCVKSINRVFPEFADRTICLENLTSRQLVNSLAGNVIPKEYAQYIGSTVIVSVGRLSHIKGYDLAVDAAAILKEKNIPVQWFVVGEGNERPALEAQIRARGVEECFHLLGLKTNPYPYIKFADVLVQSSRYEGKSVVLDEAKILGKKIIVTNYNSAKDQITHGENGLITEMTPESIAENISALIKNTEIIVHRELSDDLDDTDSVETYMRILIGED